jgi:hypothetical protein
VQRTRHRRSHGHATPRKSQNDHIVTTGVCRQPAREYTPGFDSIHEWEYFKVLVFLSE